MYDHASHHGRKHFCRYCLQTFSTKETLKRHKKDCLEINGKQKIRIPKIGEYVRFKNFQRKKNTTYDLCRF